MTNTASKLAASVQRAKAQPTHNSQESLEEVAPAVPDTATNVGEVKPRTPRTTRTKAATAKPVTAKTASCGDGDHNGGQPLFPSRVWPD